jgi:hypothetical protein
MEMNFNKPSNNVRTDMSSDISQGKWWKSAEFVSFTEEIPANDFTWINLTLLVNDPTHYRLRCSVLVGLLRQDPSSLVKMLVISRLLVTRTQGRYPAAVCLRGGPRQCAHQSLRRWDSLTLMVSLTLILSISGNSPTEGINAAVII